MSASGNIERTIILGAAAPGAIGTINVSSDIERTPSGELIVMSNNGNGEGLAGQHAALVRSTDDGDTWSSPVACLNPPAGNDAYYFYCLYFRTYTPQIGVDGIYGITSARYTFQSRIEIFYDVKDAVTGAITPKFTYSADDGVTFAAAATLGGTQPFLKTLGTTAKPILLANGTSIYVGGYYTATSGPGAIQKLYVGTIPATGDPTAMTVLASGITHDTGTSGLDAMSEPCMVQESATRFHIYARTSLQSPGYTVSTDGAATWAAVTLCPFPCATAMFQVIRTAEGNYAAIFNLGLHRDNVFLGIFTNPALTAASLISYYKLPRIQRDDVLNCQDAYPHIIQGPGRFDITRNRLYNTDGVRQGRTSSIVYNRIMTSTMLTPAMDVGTYTGVQLALSDVTTRHWFVLDVKAASASVAWAVGYWDTFGKTTDGGATWTQMATLTGGDNVAVACIGTSNVMVISDPAVSSYSPNGGTGASVQTAMDHQGTGVWGVLVSSTRHWFVTTDDGLILESTDDGATWPTAWDNAGTALRGGAVSTGYHWAVGSSGSVLRAPVSTRVWVNYSLGSFSEDLTDVATCGLTVIIVGDHGAIYVSTTDGNYIFLKYTLPVDERISSVAIKSDGSRALVVTTAGSRYESTDATFSVWTLSPAPPLHSYGKACNGVTRLFFAGDNGTVWHD